jgi:hypothetical protein
MPTKIVLEQHGESIDSLERGLEATLRLAFDPELDGISGRYFDREDDVRANEAAYDPLVQRQLRELSERLAGDFLQ